MTPDAKDIYQRFELQVRTPKKRILLDAFLPAPGTLESTVAPQLPPHLPIPEMTPEEANMFRRREPEDDEPAPAPKTRPRRKAAARKKEEPRSLQDEVAEFMSRDRPALAPDDDLTALVDNALDPKTDTDKKD
jgi:type IV secretory pathway VirB10-like protein